MSKITDFLLDESRNDEVFDFSYRNSKIHKEVYNDRFTVIYLKDHKDFLYQNPYSVNGYLDIKENVIYNCGYDLQRLIPEDEKIKFDSFENLETKIKKEIDKYIENYAFENSDSLKALAYEKHEDKTDYRFNSYQKDVRKLFIKEEEPTIKFEKFYNESPFTNSEVFYYKGYVDEYLNNSEETIKKYANLIIEKNEENLGLTLHLYDDKNKYLNYIKQNKGNEFKELYINKKIYNAIKDRDIRTLNITIVYNNKELTFKYDYDNLKRSLICDDRDSSGWGASYSRVKDFLTENKINEENLYRRDSFEFSHIKSITYGKNELYRNDNVDKIKNRDKER